MRCCHIHPEKADVFVLREDGINRQFCVCASVVSSKDEVRTGVLVVCSLAAPRLRCFGVLESGSS